MFVHFTILAKLESLDGEAFGEHVPPLRRRRQRRRPLRRRSGCRETRSENGRMDGDAGNFGQHQFFNE